MFVYQNIEIEEKMIFAVLWKQRSNSTKSHVPAVHNTQYQFKYKIQILGCLKLKRYIPHRYIFLYKSALQVLMSVSKSKPHYRSPRLSSQGYQKKK